VAQASLRPNLPVSPEESQVAKTNMNIDVGALFEQAQSQFSGLNPNEPGQWPLLPKLASFVFAAILIFGVGWVALLSGQRDELEAERNKEPQLKQEFRDKVAQAVNLAELRKQLIQVDEYVTRQAWVEASTSSCSARGRSWSRTTTPSCRFPSA
jgi:hypothetical protein